MTRAEVQRLCRQVGLRPDRAAGQNFLLPESVARLMVQQSGVKPGDVVLEIGPGLGILTDELVSAGAKVVGVELDVRLAEFLRRRYAKESLVKIIQGDIFRVRLPELVEDRQYYLVANLPYGGTSLVFRNFLTISPRPRRLTVMIQKEVAQRVVASPGEMSLLGLLAQYYSRPEIVQDVPRTSFWPVPEVTSSIIDAVVLSPRPAEEAQAVFRLARTAFAGRRKQLINSLSTLPGFSKAKAEIILRQSGLGAHLRPQDLRVKDWQTLAKNFL